MEAFEYDKEFMEINNSVPYWLYIIESTSGHFKIGVSNNPINRLKQLMATQGPFVYEIINCTPFFYDFAAREIEKKFHDLFKESRVNGEWFSLYPRDLLTLGYILHSYKSMYEDHISNIKGKTEKEIKEYAEGMHNGI